jgi:hypothetical protein
MSQMKAETRNSLPSSEFGMPGERKYPMPDKSHAANAKARASQQESNGNITASTKASIYAKANRVLGHKNVRNAESHSKKLMHE